jgi:hypothetical protein
LTPEKKSAMSSSSSIKPWPANTAQNCQVYDTQTQFGVPDIENNRPVCRLVQTSDEQKKEQARSDDYDQWIGQYYDQSMKAYHYFAEISRALDMIREVMVVDTQTYNELINANPDAKSTDDDTMQKNILTVTVELAKQNNFVSYLLRHPEENDLLNKLLNRLEEIRIKIQQDLYYCFPVGISRNTAKDSFAMPNAEFTRDRIILSGCANLTQIATEIERVSKIFVQAVYDIFDRSTIENKKIADAAAAAQNQPGSNNRIVGWIKPYVGAIFKAITDG